MWQEAKENSTYMFVWAWGYFLSQLLTARAPLTHNTCTLKQAGGKTLCIKTSWGPHASYFCMLFLHSLISVYTSTLCFLHYNSSSRVHKSFCFIKSHSGPPRVSTDPAADELSWPLAFIIITLYFFQYIYKTVCLQFIIKHFVWENK